MALYLIYHCYEPNGFQEVDVQPRKYVGCVEAISLDEAYYLSQNFDEPWNPITPCRSTSVGDIIQSDDDFFMVCNSGFQLLLADDTPFITNISAKIEDVRKLISDTSAELTTAQYDLCIPPFNVENDSDAKEYSVWYTEQKELIHQLEIDLSFYKERLSELLIEQSL
jgi:hypothetical protein